MDLHNSYYIILIILIIIIIFITIFFLKFKKISKILKEIQNKRKENSQIEEYDTFMQFSTSSLTFDGVYNLLSNYDKDIFNLNECNFLNQTVSYESNIDYVDLPKNYNYVSNSFPHINNKYIEMFDDTNYFGLSKNKFKLEKEIEFYLGDYDNQMFVGSYKRLDDKKDFIFVSMYQKYKNYTADKTFKGLYQMIYTIKKLYPEQPYIITGNVNLQGHEKVFEELLSDALICNVHKKVCTANNFNGIASPECLVVSNKLYKKVEYEVDFFKGFSMQHYPILAKFYKNGKNEVINKTNNGFKETVQYYIDISKQNIFINNKSLFDILKHKEEKLCVKKNIINIFSTSKTKRNVINN